MLTTSILAVAMLASAADSVAVVPDAVSPAQSAPVAAGEVARPRLVLSREECLKIALSDNPTVKVADMEVTRADYSRRETLAGVFPTVDFNGAYQRTIKLQTMSMDFGGQSQTIKVGSDNTWNLGFNASMPLVAPTLWKAISIADTQILANLEQSRASRLDLVHQVNQAYYSLMLAISSRDVIRDNYELARYNADLYEKQFQAGTASEYDVLRSSVQVKNVEPELLQADIAVKQCQLQLNVLMGFAGDVEIMPDVRLSDMQRDMYGAYSTYSLSDNTSLRSLDIQRTLADKNVDLKKLAWVPTLAATFSYSWTALSNGTAVKNQQFNPYSTVGLAVSVPIFSGLSKYYGLKQAQVQRKELDLQRENLINTLTMQADLAIDNINREVRQIATSEEGVRQAVKAHDIMQRSFEIGAASYLDLRDSELAETSARLAYLQSIYNYLVSTSELDLLLGRGVPENQQ